MKRLYAVAGASIALLTAGPAYAQLLGDPGGFYMGVGLGEFSTQINDIDQVDDVELDFDQDEDAKKVFAGWRFNRLVAVQADYYDFADSQTALGILPLGVETDGFAPSIVGTLPLGPYELFVRAGVMFYDLHVRLGADDVIDESGSDAVYSAGVGYTLLGRLNFKAEYEVIDINDYDDANAVWISAAWRF